MGFPSKVDLFLIGVLAQNFRRIAVLLLQLWGSTEAFTLSWSRRGRILARPWLSLGEAPQKVWAALDSKGLIRPSIDWFLYPVGVECRVIVSRDIDLRGFSMVASAWLLDERFFGGIHLS